MAKPKLKSKALENPTLAKAPIDPVTGKPVEGGDGQLDGLSKALRGPVAASPLGAKSQGASDGAATQAGAGVAPTSVQRSAPGVATTGATGTQSSLGSQRSTTATPQTPGPGETSNALGAPQPGATPSPEQRVADALAAAPAPTPAAPLGGAATDLGAALRYGQSVAPDPAAVAAGQQAQGLDQATKGLGGLDALLQKRFDERLAAGPATTMGGGGDVGLAPGATADASSFLHDARDAADRLGDLTKSALADQASYRLTDADVAELGFDTPESLRQLESVLGRSPVGATAQEVHDALDAAAGRTEAQARSSESAADDLRLGRTSHEAAVDSSTDAARLAAPSLQDVSKTLDSVEAGDSLKFKGENVPLASLLSSGAASDWVSAYAKADPVEKARLAKDEPDLAEWVDSNAPAVEAAVQSERQGAEAQAKSYGEQAQWLQGANALGLGAAGTTLFEAAKSGSAVAQSLASPAALAAAGVVDPTSVGPQLQALAKANPEVYSQLLAGDLGDAGDLVSSLGLGSLGTDVASQAKWQGLVRHADELTAIQALERKQTSGEAISADEVLHALFPTGGTLADVKELWAQERRAGSPPSAIGQTLKAALDPDGNGAVTTDTNWNLAALAKAVAKAGLRPAGGTSLSDALATAKGATAAPDLGLARALGDRQFDSSESRDVADALLGGSAQSPTVSAADALKSLDRLGVRDSALQDPFVRQSIDAAAAKDVVSALGAGLPAGSGQWLNDYFYRESNPAELAKVLGGRDAVQASLARTYDFLNAGGLDPYTKSKFELAKAALTEALRSAT